MPNHRTGQTFACTRCGVSIYRQKSEIAINAQGVYFCSRACAKGAPHIAHLKRTCPTCAQAFSFARFLIGTRLDPKYCSRQCANDRARNKRMRICAGCQIEFVADKAEQVYCTRACWKTHQYKSVQEERVVLRIADLLKETPIRQMTFSWLRNGKRFLYLDAYFPNHRIAIEYDGPQHRRYMPRYHKSVEAFERGVQLDNLKESLVVQHGLWLLRIRSDGPTTPEYLRALLRQHQVVGV